MTSQRSWSRALLVVVLLGGAAPGACTPVVGTPIDEGRTPHERPGATEGPWARCRFETDAPGPEDRPTRCPDPAAGNGAWTCDVGTETRRFADTQYVYCWAAAACSYACSEAADCPAPPGGPAEMVCVGNRCQLSCTRDADCPEAMRCIDEGEMSAPGRCMWVFADFCDNGTISPANPCSGRARCEACQACDDCEGEAFCNSDGDCEYGRLAACVDG
jgi:hypothetical protein